MKARRLLSGLLICALLAALLPISALAAPREDFAVLDTWCWEIRQRNASALPDIALAEGSHQQWIDRIDQLPGFASSFYTWLEDNATASGSLADPTKGTELGDAYVYVIDTIQGSANYRGFSGSTDEAKALAAISADLGSLPNQIAAYGAAVYGAFDRDHPEVFWLSGSSSYGLGTSYTYSSGVVNYTAYIYFYLKHSSFDLRKPEYQSVSAIREDCLLRDQRVEAILADCTATSDVDRIIYLNDVLTQSNAYNSAVGVGNQAAASANAWECVSALEGNTGVDGPVCEGYARAFKVLCDALEIPCVLAEGLAAVSDTDTPGGHMWNLVQVDGAWLLLGSRTRCNTGLTFAQSHRETNKTTIDSLEYINGPVLSAEAYTFPVAVPSIALKYPTVSFEDEVIMDVFFDVTDLGSITPDKMGLITFTSEVADGTVENADAVIPGAVLNDATGFYSVHTNGISAKNLGDEIYFRVYIELPDGSYVYSKMVHYSPKTYAYTVLNGNYSSNMKSLVAAMLNYGAAAQVYFGHNTDALINADMTDAHKAHAEDYNSSMIAPVVKADSAKAVNFAGNGGFSRRYPSISFESAFCINYFFAPAYAVEGDITLYYWTAADYNGADVLTVENATGSVVATSGSEYEAAVKGIAAKDLDSTIYVAAVYKSGSTICCSGVLAYSIGAYCLDRITNGSAAMQGFAAATAVYGYYAKAYFAK